MPIKILAMSDIHGCFEMFDPEDMPNADICVVAGDITNGGTKDMKVFTQSKEWMKNLTKKYPLTLWISGNHDLRIKPEDYDSIGGRDSNSLHCIYDKRYDYVSEKGNLSFYGVTMCPCYDRPDLAAWAHSTTNREVEAAAYDMPVVDIVVSHCPPWLMLDRTDMYPLGRSIGSFPLRRYIEKHQPKLVISGHVHESVGEMSYGATRVHNVATTYRLLEVEGHGEDNST